MSCPIAAEKTNGLYRCTREALHGGPCAAEPVKPTARIDNWELYKSEGVPIFLSGTVSEHPRQSEFKKELQATSRIVKFDEAAGICETLNTIYTLGKKA